MTDLGANQTVAGLGPCNTNRQGSLISVKDATSATRGTPLTGGGSLYAVAQCDGAGWKVY